VRPVGGLGIHFIKSLMDEVAYARVDGKNQLRLRKKLPG
jgi:anti-sigma regulatory factor (Ser/Thr protein kinase)